MTTIVHNGQTENFALGQGSAPLDLLVLNGGTANISDGWSTDTFRVEAFGGGRINIGVFPHIIATGTVNANGGSIAFDPPQMNSWDNSGTSMAANGGSVQVPLGVIGTGLFLVNPGGTMTFASAYNGSPFTAAGVASTQTVKVQGGTLVLDYAPGYQAATTLDATGVIDINNLVADSATYDPIGHLVDFVGGGQVLAALSVTPTAPGATVKIADLGGGSWQLTDPPAAMAHSGRQPPPHFQGAWA